MSCGGLAPISSNSAGDMVKDKKLKEMSVKSYYNRDDIAIGIVLNIIPTTLHSLTVEIKGR